MSTFRRRALAAAAVLVGAAGFAPTLAEAAPSKQLTWSACADYEGFECATATVPLDYSKPDGATYAIPMLRKPAIDRANRIGSLFINPGGPGGGGNDFLAAVADRYFGTLNQRYDLVAWDPRGTGATEGAFDCQVNQETEGLYRTPVPNPLTVDYAKLFSLDIAFTTKCAELNKDLLPYATTGNVARDLDRMRAGVHDVRLNYFGYSYGTYIGATYGKLFPQRVGRFVLDGPVDAEEYAEEPLTDLDVQTAAFERALDRFFSACAADQTACLGFGGTDPQGAYDQLVDAANETPIPVSGAYGTDADPRPVDGDDLNTAVLYDLYAKQYWPEIAQALSEAAAGDGSLVRALVNGYNGFDPETGTFDPGSDRYFLIGALDQPFGSDIFGTLKAGVRGWKTFEHFSGNTGYVALNYQLLQLRSDWKPNGRVGGPFSLPRDANHPVIIGTRYDPATPWRGAQALAADLKSPLVQYVGDGHTAYPTGEPCIDDAVDGYLLDGTPVPNGLTCIQNEPFAQPEPEATTFAAPDGTAGPSDAEVQAKVRKIAPYLVR